MLAQQLRNLRIQKAMSQSEVAKLVGVSQQAVGKWERSKAEPDSKTLLKLAKFFGVTVDRLLEDGASHEKRKYPPAPSPEAMRLANDYDSLDAEGKNTLMNVLAGLMLTNARRDRVLQA